MKKYLFIIVLILLIPLGFYIFYFHNNSIGNPVDWSYFGNFYGGILTPIITAITTVLLTYITVTISKKTEANQKESLILDYKRKVLIDIMNHQNTLNYVKSKIYVKDILVKNEHSKISDEYDRLDSERKRCVGSKKEYERPINDKIVLSVRLFYSNIISKVSEVSKYYEYMSVNHSLLFEMSILNIDNIKIINEELSVLNKILQDCMLKGEVVLPKNIDKIETEISKLLKYISNN